MDENDFISLVAAKEAETGEWLGSDLIESESYERDDYDGSDNIDWDWEISQAENANDRVCYGE